MMKMIKKLSAAACLSAVLILFPNSFSAQGHGNGKHDKEDHKQDKGNKHDKGGKIKIDFTIGDKKGHKNDVFSGKPGHGNQPFDHPGKGHAYGRYKWNPSKNIEEARGRHRDLLKITIALVLATDDFLGKGKTRLEVSRNKLDISIKANKIDIKVRERRAARIQLATLKAKELDDLVVKSKVKLKL